MFILIWILLFILGIAIGIFIEGFRQSKQYVGTFVINKTDPAKEPFIIRFENDISDGQTKAVFDVRLE